MPFKPQRGCGCRRLAQAVDARFLPLEGDLDEDPQAPADIFETRLRWAVKGWSVVAVLLAVAMLGIGTCLDAVRERRPSSRLGSMAASGVLRQQEVTGSEFWFMCSGLHQCGRESQKMYRWALDPATLAYNVPADFSVLPGVNPVAYAAVVKQWREKPPIFWGAPIALKDIADFVRELLSSDPFGTGTYVPFVDFGVGGDAKVAAVTQRQVAFLVANALLGNTIAAGDGLSAALRRCNLPEHTGLLYSLLSMLGILSKELGDGRAGRVLVGLTPRPRDDSWKELLGKQNLVRPSVCMKENPEIESACHTAVEGEDCWDEVTWGMRAGIYADTNLFDGLTEASTFVEFQEALYRSGSSRCPKPCPQAAQRSVCEFPDFMFGGPPFQALTDIAGGVVGGGAQLCNPANTQDESLVQFYSEVLAFSFFAAGSELKMLAVPFVLLGARRYVGDISGESSTGAPWWNTCGRIREVNWLNEVIQQEAAIVTIGVTGVEIPASAFVAVASSAVAIDGKCTFSQAMNNQCDGQRRHLDLDVALWYQAYASTMYESSVQDAFDQIVQRVGTGPWGAGVWWGDSQHYFLTSWLAQSLTGRAPLDYYVYDHFCENPANQCFTLGKAGCAACINRSKVDGIQTARCGDQDINAVVAAWADRPAADLYEALQRLPGPPSQVFDVLSLPEEAKK